MVLDVALVMVTCDQAPTCRDSAALRDPWQAWQHDRNVSGILHQGWLDKILKLVVPSTAVKLYGVQQVHDPYERCSPCHMLRNFYIKRRTLGKHDIVTGIVGAWLMVLYC